MSGTKFVTYWPEAKPLPGTDVKQHSVVAMPLDPDQELLAVVGALGEARMFVVSRFAALQGHPQVWGCGVCEQLHPIEVKSCPLVHYPVKDVTLGPYVIAGTALYFRLKASAVAHIDLEALARASLSSSGSGRGTGK